MRKKMTQLSTYAHDYQKHIHVPESQRETDKQEICLTSFIQSSKTLALGGDVALKSSLTNINSFYMSFIQCHRFSFIVGIKMDAKSLQLKAVDSSHDCQKVITGSVRDFRNDSLHYFTLNYQQYFCYLRIYHGYLFRSKFPLHQVVLFLSELISLLYQLIHFLTHVLTVFEYRICIFMLLPEEKNSQPLMLLFLN